MPRTLSPARHWSGRRLLLTWSGCLSALLALRWMMSAGVVEATIVEHRVIRTAGYWPAEFAALTTAGAAAIVGSVLLWLTFAWLAARKERAALRAAERAGHRRVLM